MTCFFCEKEMKRVVCETNNFFVYVGKAIITSGHIMIISKKHYLAMGEIDYNLIEEYENLKFSLTKIITECFAEPFVVEYGVFGQSVFHAHTHFIPKTGENYKNINIIESMLFPSIKKHFIPYLVVNNFQTLKEIYEKDKQYFYCEDNNQKYVLKTKNFSENDILNDISYRDFFNKIGIKGIKSWKDMEEEDIALDNLKMQQTLNKIKPIFNIN